MARKLVALLILHNINYQQLSDWLIKRGWFAPVLFVWCLYVLCKVCVGT